MSFRWSVNFGHYSAKYIRQRPLRIFAINSEKPRLHNNPNVLTEGQEPFTLALGCPLIRHITDDISIIDIDIPQRIMRLWNRIIPQLFSAAPLPVTEKKLLPSDSIVFDAVPFICMTINLSTDIILPKPNKFDK